MAHSCAASPASVRPLMRWFPGAPAVPAVGWLVIGHQMCASSSVQPFVGCKLNACLLLNDYYSVIEYNAGGRAFPGGLATLLVVQPRSRRRPRRRHALGCNVLLSPAPPAGHAHSWPNSSSARHPLKPTPRLRVPSRAPCANPNCVWQRAAWLASVHAFGVKAVSGGALPRSPSGVQESLWARFRAGPRPRRALALA